MIEREYDFTEIGFEHPHNSVDHPLLCPITEKPIHKLGIYARAGFSGRKRVGEFRI